MPMNNLETFLWFVKERESMRVKKEAGQPAPWTDNFVLTSYRFCNVRRRDDRVSRWLLKEYYPKFFDKNDDVWFVAAIARLINWPPTLKFLLDAGVIPSNMIHYDPKNFAATLERHHQISLKVNNHKTYTGAYMLYAGGMNPKYKGVIKSDFIANHVLIDLFEKREKLRAALKTRLARCFSEALQGCFSFSSFMAGQVTADLSYLPGQLQGAEDLLSYAPQGPGSVRGLNRVLGVKLSVSWKQPDFEVQLMKLWAAVVGVLPDLQYSLTLHDVQNCLCEFDKYMRATLGEGKPRSFYRSETAYEV